MHMNKLYFFCSGAGLSFECGIVDEQVPSPFLDHSAHMPLLLAGGAVVTKQKTPVNSLAVAVHGQL